MEQTKGWYGPKNLIPLVRNGLDDFYEDNHLKRDMDLDTVIKGIVQVMKQRKIYKK